MKNDSIENKNEYKEFYTEESSVYQRKRYETLYGKIFKTLHHNILAEVLKPLKKNDLVLEVACGTGHTSILLAELECNLISCDLTPAMMQHAKQRVANMPVQPLFVEADAKILPFADNSIDWVVSTRFLHLFPYEIQVEVLTEMLRVLKPNGKIIVDFDNWSSRWLLALPFLMYNLVRYQRIAPYSFYNKISKTKEILSQLNASVDNVIGVGGVQLVLAGFFSKSLAVKLGHFHRKPPLRFLAEQFIVFAHKL